jgi:type I restriction-modification system DNA methylase subunit
MPTDHRTKLASIRRFDQLIAYLRDEMGWPIARDSFDDVDDLFYDFTPEELGIDAKNSAKIQEIKRLRPLSTQQPWGIFFVKFEPKRLPVVALRRILSQVVLKKRASANNAERRAWAEDDLLFVSNYGVGDERRISFAHFSKAREDHDLPTLKVLGWDNLDTLLHLDDVAEKLTDNLAWPEDETDVDAWRERWHAAFTLRHREVITTSKELSLRLAVLARAIRDRIKTALAIETDTGQLTKLMKAFQGALVHDLDAAGFADMYSQTITYGLLSARIGSPEKKTADDLTAQMRTNPFLKELMQTFLRVGGRRGKAGSPGIDFDELGVSEVVELLDDANMEAVVRDFGDRNPLEDPVIHFYEHFLAAYDKKQKVRRGVFYTPRPVVTYIVRSVDELLRAEFSLEDGFADTTTWGEIAERQEAVEIPEGVSPDQTFVQILDPGTGTGTFLVEVIDLIHRTMIKKWKAQRLNNEKIQELWNNYVPKHLLPRLHGYELLMAPYAIAHLKIGLKLYETGYRFASDERARVYLTNALEPASDKQFGLDFLPALAHEAQAVNEIKRKQRFTAVIGNPPYSNYGQMNTNPWILKLLDRYKKNLNEKKLNLDDDYVKFIRFAHYTVEEAGLGIVGFITNHTYLDGVTHRRLRECLMESFNSLCFLDLHGSIKKAERCSDGTPDKNVFEIQQGVAIKLLARSRATHARSKGCVVLQADLWGTRNSKSTWLLQNTKESTAWTTLHPIPERFYFVQKNFANEAEYQSFVSLRELFHEAATGFETARDHFAIAFSSDELRTRVAALTEDTPDALVRRIWGLDDKRDWALATARDRLRAMANPFADIRICCYRPLDFRFTHYNDIIVTWPRVKVLGSINSGNPALVASRMVKGEDPQHLFVVDEPTEKIFISGKTSNNAFIFPLYVRRAPNGLLAQPGKSASNGKSLNVREDAIGTLLSETGVEYEQDEHDAVSLAAIQYTYAVLSSPHYRSRYQEFLKIDFPRVPVPGSQSLFLALARLGGELITQHLMKSPNLDHFITTYTGPTNSVVGRVGWSSDTVWLDAGKTSARDGHRATKPGTIGFHGVTEEVWDFHIGGYQVCHKWLKDRKGRTLSKDDLAHYQKIVVVLNETIRIMQEIDEVIEAHLGWPGAFQIAAPAREPEQHIFKAAESEAKYHFRKDTEEK